MLSVDGTFGVGYTVTWTERDMPRARAFTGEGFSQAAKNFVAQLLSRGFQPVVYAMLKTWELSKADADVHPRMILDNWIPVLNHFMVEQQAGRGMQDTPRSRPTKTFKEIQEEVHGGSRSDV